MFENLTFAAIDAEIVTIDAQLRDIGAGLKSYEEEFRGLSLRAALGPLSKVERQQQTNLQQTIERIGSYPGVDDLKRRREELTTARRDLFREVDELTAELANVEPLLSGAQADLEASQREFWRMRGRRDELTGKVELLKGRIAEIGTAPETNLDDVTSLLQSLDQLRQQPPTVFIDPAAFSDLR